MLKGRFRASAVRSDERITLETSTLPFYLTVVIDYGDNREYCHHPSSSITSCELGTFVLSMVSNTRGRRPLLRDPKIQTLEAVTVRFITSLVVLLHRTECQTELMYCETEPPVYRCCPRA